MFGMDEQIPWDENKVYTLDNLEVSEFGGFTIWCATHGEAKTCSESWEKAYIQSLRNMNFTREQMPMFVQFDNMNYWCCTLCTWLRTASCSYIKSYWAHRILLWVVFQYIMFMYLTLCLNPMVKRPGMLTSSHDLLRVLASQRAAHRIVNPLNRPVSQYDPTHMVALASSTCVNKTSKIITEFTCKDPFLHLKWAN